MISAFDITHIAFSVAGYPLSYVELFGTVFGLLSVFHASRANVLTWSTGIVNEFFFFLLFFQLQLYADMFLQIFFFAVTIYGWYNWKTTKATNEVYQLTAIGKILVLTAVATGVLLAGFLFSNIHLYLPGFFKLKAAYPYADSLIMALSISATFLLAQKKIETWYLWIAADVICVLLYYKKGVYFLSAEYFIFLCLAGYGLSRWRKQLQSE